MCAYPVIKTAGGVTNAVIAPNLPQMARGTTVTFEQDFFDDAPANTQPSTPIDASAFPSWTVVDLDGAQVGTGVGIPGSQVGRWQTQWNVLVDAPLSTKDNKWRVIWRMQSASGRQLDATVYFDVIDLITPDRPEDLRAYSYLAYAGNSERLLLQRPRQPAELTVAVFQSAKGTNLRPSTKPCWTGSLADGTIKEVADGSLFVYYFDTPTIAEPAEYQVVWSLRETIISPQDTFVQRLVVPDPLFWSLAPELRVLIDKLQKNLGSIHAYSDADLYSYLTQGLGILNGVIPATGFTWQTFPLDYNTRMYWLEAGALWAMQAQHLLEVELLFSFSGQTVTLDVDRTGGYEGVITRLLEDIKGTGPNNWPNVKRNLTRRVQPVASVGVRMMGRRYQNQITYQVDQAPVGLTTDGGLFSLLGRLGLV